MNDTQKNIVTLRSTNYKDMISSPIVEEGTASLNLVESCP